MRISSINGWMGWKAYYSKHAHTKANPHHHDDVAKAVKKVENWKDAHRLVHCLLRDVIRVTGNNSSRKTNQAH